MQFTDTIPSAFGSRGPDLAVPFGPLRFDYAVPLTKGKDEWCRQFKFAADLVLSLTDMIRKRGPVSEKIMLKQ